MKIIQKTYSVYSFSELSKEVQAKVLEKHRDINVESDYWDECILEDWTAKLEKLGYYNVKIYYSGFWSQGDGACFIAKVNIKQWIKAHKTGGYLKKLLEDIEAGHGASISITHSSRYYYSTSTSVNDDDYIELSKKGQDQFYTLLKTIELERETLGNELYKDLEANYNDLTTDEEVIETIKANDYQFTEAGEIDG